jgi:carboxylesterase type B
MASYPEDGRIQDFEIAFLETLLMPHFTGTTLARTSWGLPGLTQNRSKCPQPSERNNTRIFQSHLDFHPDITESELDCLNLFITRPSAAALQKANCYDDGGLPVMVWIHGGGYGFGAGTDTAWGGYHILTA